jgi:hypothetical protein
VEILRKNFVPVAIDLRVDEHHDAIVPGSEAAGKRDAERQQRKAWGGLDQHRPIGMHVVLPNDKVIASFACRWVASGERPVDDLLGFLKGALARAGSVPERNAKIGPLHPNRGVGVRNDGSIRLAVYARTLEKGRPVSHRPVFESAYLNARLMDTLTPGKVRVGERYLIPAEAARQLSTVLTDDGDDVFRIRPHEVTGVKLSAEVINVSKSGCVVSLAGELAGKRVYSGGTVAAQAKLQGLLQFGSKRELQSVLIVSDGQYRSPWARETHTVGGLIEWARQGTRAPRETLSPSPLR